jgi:hypothetical protein
MVTELGLVQSAQGVATITLDPIAIAESTPKPSRVPPWKAQAELKRPLSGYSACGYPPGSSPGRNLFGFVLVRG